MCDKNDPQGEMRRRIASIDPLELATKHPEWSASVPITPVQKKSVLALFVILLIAMVLAPLGTARFLIALCIIFYVILTIYKFIVIRASISPDASMNFTADEIFAQEPREWPMYTVLIPMYKEPEVLEQMVKAMTEMDYPADKKDIQFLLEEDDKATLDLAKTLDMPQGFRIVKIPESFPRTKPKACNIGLHIAQGKYLVIYDADDVPESDQLKKAVMAFEKSEDKVACIQSRLNYYNPMQSILTRWFTAEYSTWYDLQLPGLSALKALIPLGGTSNHFKTAVLQELMGWDAYNVTEDCDLGVRIVRAGYATRMLTTTTWEEACGHLPSWIKQRTRWQKGYIQTWFVHMRHPIQLFKEIGLINYMHYQLLIGGATFSVLVNPVFWIMTAIWFIFKPVGVAILFPGPIFAAGAFCLFVGNFVFVYVTLLGCYKRERDSLLWISLFTPIYWFLMSVSGWRAFIQFFKDPFVWEKTQHGLAQQSTET